MSCTRSVREFKRDGSLRLVMLPHAEAAGANLAEASVLIRISIDSADPGQAIQQRGRLTRHTQTQDLNEVIIVSPGWEYMLLQLQQTYLSERKANGLKQNTRFSNPSPKCLAMHLFRLLSCGTRLGFDPWQSRPPSQRLAFVMRAVAVSGLVLGENASLHFTPPSGGLLVRHSPFATVQFDEFKSTFAKPTTTLTCARNQKQVFTWSALLLAVWRKHPCSNRLCTEDNCCSACQQNIAAELLGRASPNKERKREEAGD